MANNVSDRMGFENPAKSQRPGPAGNHLGTPTPQPGAPAQLLPTEPIGIQPAQSSGQQGGGGSHGGSFLKGLGEARPSGLPDLGGGAAAGGEAAAGGAAAGGAEAVAGAGALEELAPLALLAL